MHCRLIKYLSFLTMTIVAGCGASGGSSASAPLNTQGLRSNPSVATSSTSAFTGIRPVTPQILKQLPTLQGSIGTTVGSSMPVQPLKPATILYPANSGTTSLLSSDAIRTRSAVSVNSALLQQSITTSTYAQLLAADPKAVARVDVSPERLVSIVRSKIVQPFTTRAGSFTSGTHVEVFDAASGDLFYAQTIGIEIPDLHSGPARIPH